MNLNGKPVVISGQHFIVAIAGINGHPHPNLSKIRKALGPLGFFFGAANAGSNIAARMAIIAMTTSSSINVKACRRTGIGF